MPFNKRGALQKNPAGLFSNPPPETRMLKILHKGIGDPQELLSKGFGGAVTNVPFGNGYVENERNWQAFIEDVHRAKDAGLSLWLYDELGYPSGRAGEIVLRDHPELEACALLIKDMVCDEGEVALDIPPGNILFASAFSMTDGIIQIKPAFDLPSYINEGKLSWRAPAGKWQVIVAAEHHLYEGSQVADPSVVPPGKKYVNLLLPETTARFIEITHEKYADHLGQNLGGYFVSTFTDEPSLLAMFFEHMPYKPLPWSKNLPDEFKRRRGYELTPLIPALVVDAGDRGRKIRYDFWQTVSELFAENYFGQLQDWHRVHSILFGGHLLLEENILQHVPLYGDFFRCLRSMDAPGIDVLSTALEEPSVVDMQLMGREVPWYAARLASSAAELENRKYIMSETTDAVQQWDGRSASVEEFRGALGRIILGGVTSVNSYSQFKGFDDEQLRQLNLWVGRCCLMLTGGHRAAETAVMYPIESTWIEFTPSHQGVLEASETAKRIARLFRAVGDNLYAARKEFSFIDSRTLLEAEVENGELIYSDLKWRAVVLPSVTTMPMVCWKKLLQLWESGGIIISIGSLPTNSEKEFPSSEVQEISRKLFGDPTNPDGITSASEGIGLFLPSEQEQMLPEKLVELIPWDLAELDKNSPIRYTHRRIDRREVYFLFNDSAEPWKGRITLAVQGPGEQWDPANGQMKPVPSGQGITLALEAYGAMIYRFKEKE